MLHRGVDVVCYVVTFGCMQTLRRNFFRLKVGLQGTQTSSRVNHDAAFMIYSDDATDILLHPTSSIPS